MASSGELFPSRVVAPGDGLVVEGVIPEAAVQVADEAVAEGAQRLVVRIAGDLAVVVTVRAYQVGEDLRVAGVGLGTTDVVALAITGHRARVDRVDVVAGRN